MPRYISSQQNRIYTVLESSYASVTPATSANRLPALELTVTDQALRPRRLDKTGTRTEMSLSGPFRHNIRYQLRTYLTGGTVSGSGCAALAEAALGHSNAHHPSTSAQANGNTLTFSSSHNLRKGDAVATTNEIRFVAEVLSPVGVSLNAPFDSGTSSPTLLPAISIAPSTNLPSLSVFDYWYPVSGVQRILAGAGLNSFRFSVNGDLHTIEADGPAAIMIDSTTFREGEGNLNSIPPEPELSSSCAMPIPGHLGQVWIGSSAGKLLTLTAAEFTLNNNLDTRHFEYGSPTARALVPGRREVSLNFEIYAEEGDATIDLFRSAKSEQQVPVFIQLGARTGEMFAIFLPNVTLEVPRFDSSEPRLLWQFKNCRASGVADDEVFFAFA